MDQMAPGGVPYPPELAGMVHMIEVSAVVRGWGDQEA